MHPFTVIEKPLLSEKTTQERENQNKYTFIVALKASKLDVKKAVERMFEVDVKSVNTSILRGKLKRRGMYLTMRSNRKKAVVTLKEGHKIKLFEDQ